MVKVITDATTDHPAGATSNANVQVVSGVLILDAVPDFGFGSTAAGSTAKLANNDAIGTGEDGNNAGLLQVTDARANAGSTMGFNLTANLGGFNKLDGSTVGDAVTTTDPFILTMNPEELTNADGDNISTDGVSKTKTETAALASQGKDAGAQDVISLAAGSYKEGQISANFNTPESAKLAVPSIDGSNGDYTKPSAQSYTSAITWVLTATPAVKA